MDRKRGLRWMSAPSLLRSDYKYTALDEGNGEIRLLTLLPGKFSSKIRVRLDTTRFTESHVPKFEALSYTWGSTDNPAYIFIGESGPKALAITRNLAEALPYLRHESKPRVMWIDAICVDQKNLEERSQQVKRMADIFSKAVRVLVWLGPESDDSQLALDCLERIASNIEYDTVTHSLVAMTDESHWADTSITVPLNTVELLAICRFIHRPWFERLWIWQEVHLASRGAEVMCGGRKISWSALRSACFCLYYKPKPYFDQRGVFQKRIDAVTDLCVDKSGLNSIDYLLHQSKHCICSDARDKIYALLSLLPKHVAVKIEPDYTQGLYEAYKDAILSVIESTKSLVVLRTVESHEHLENVPSWVPNLVSPLPNNALTFCNASGYSSHCLPVDHGSRILKIEGVAIVAITQVEPILFFDQELGHEEGVRGLVSIAERTGVRGVSIQSHQHKAFTRTIFADCFRERLLPVNPVFPSTEESEVTTYKILTSDIDLLLLEESISPESMSKVRNYCDGRALYMAEDGMYGLSPLAALPGDIIAVLLGFDSTMVLRPTPAGKYKVIGEAYSDGFMYGEALLGPLPDTFKAIWRHKGSVDVNSHFWGYYNNETGVIQAEDPRLGPLPPRWSLLNHENEEFLHHFKNDETGETTWFDPRLTSQELKKRGIPIKVFELV